MPLLVAISGVGKAGLKTTYGGQKWQEDFGHSTQR